MAALCVGYQPQELGAAEGPAMGHQDRPVADWRGVLMKLKGHSHSTMTKWWRAAVIEHCRYTCQVCGRECAADELEAHHLVAKSYRGLRYNFRNGAAVCRGACHTIADMRTGTSMILKKWQYTGFLESMVMSYRTYPEMLKGIGMKEKNHLYVQLAELKVIAKGYSNDEII